MGRSPNPTIASGRELHPGVKPSKGRLQRDGENLVDDSQRRRGHRPVATVGRSIQRVAFVNIIQ